MRGLARLDSKAELGLVAGLGKMLDECGGFAWHEYPECKDSGVSWLGDIPAHWGLKRLKYTLKLVNEKIESIDSDLPYFGLENIESWTGRKVETENQPEGVANRFEPGDVLFGKLRPYLAKVYHAQAGGGLCTGEALVLRGKDLVPRYLLYYLLSKDLINIVDSSTYGSKMPRANWDFIGNLPALLPEAEEQTAIATFLDRETARIDSLIAKKQRLIELLQEKRTALISQAVTKGLEPGVPMKDSGVEWLGEIPAHWEVKPLRWYLRTGSGDFLSNDRFEREMTPEFQTKVIGGNGVTGYTDIANTEESTIVIGRVGAHCGNVHLVKESSWVTDNALRLSGIRAFSLDFLFCLLKAMNINRWANQNAQPLITGEMVKSKSVPCPPDIEQLEIVRYVESENGRAEKLKKKIEIAIRCLTEYRSALISSAVTGKIDVREIKG